MSNFDSLSTAERTIMEFDRFNITDVHRLGRYTYKSARESLPAHTHDGMMEICYCEKGLQVYEVNGELYHIKGGDVFITFPGELHSTAQHPEEKGVLYWLIIKMDGTDAFLNYQPEDAAAFTRALLNLPSRHFKGEPEVKRILDDIFLLNNAAAGGMKRIHILNQLTNFLLAIIRGSQKNAAIQPSSRRTEISNYIAANLYQELSVESLAAKMNFSDSHFKSWFKKEFGLPPADYILRLRIDEAKKLLQAGSENSVTDAAFRLNFSSSQYFATVFKKYTGTTPSAYRNKLLAHTQTVICLLIANFVFSGA